MFMMPCVSGIAVGLKSSAFIKYEGPGNLMYQEFSFSVKAVIAFGKLNYASDS